MPEIVICEFMDEPAVARLRERHTVLYDPDLVDRPDDLSAALADARAIIVRNRTKVTAKLLSGAPRLVCVGRLGVGLDNIDLPACAERDVTVYPATGANDVAVAEYVVTNALVLLRGAYARTMDVVRGQWPRQALIGREAMDKRLGLVGYGAIARQVARRARVFGLQIAAFDPFLAPDDAAWGETQSVDLTDLLKSCDVISLHVPLTERTRHLIGPEAIALMKPGAIVINTARGGVVDEKALAAALRDGRIGGAALDVFETEPLTAQAGEIFDGLGNIVLTPHIAGVTEESNVRVSAATARNVLTHLAGQAE